MHFGREILIVLQQDEGLRTLSVCRCRKGKITVDRRKVAAGQFLLDQGLPEIWVIVTSTIVRLLRRRGPVLAYTFDSLYEDTDCGACS